MAIIDSLEVALGFKADTTTLNQFIKRLGDLNFSAILSAAGLSGIAAGIDSIVTSAQTAGIALNVLSGTTGISTQEFQAFGLAAQEVGIPAEQLTSNLVKIKQALVGIHSTDSGTVLQSTNQLIALGRVLNYNPLSLNQSQAPKLFMDVLKAMSNMSDDDKRLFLAGARGGIPGLNDSTIMVSNNLKGFNIALSNTAETMALTAKETKELADLTVSWQRAILAIGASLEPILKDFINALKIISIWIQKINEVTPQWVKDIITAVGKIALFLAVLKAAVVTAIILRGILSSLTYGGIVGMAAAVGGWFLFQDLMKGWNDYQKNEKIRSIMHYQHLSRESATQEINTSNVRITNNYDVNGGDPKEVYKASNQAWKDSTANIGNLGY